MELTPFVQLGIAIGLGLLVGLQREWAEKEVAGIRTFPLITLFGALSALLAQSLGGQVVAAALVSLSGLPLLGALVRLHYERVHPGVTTEVAALVMFAVGALLIAGYTTLAIAVGGAVALLLHWKQPLHEFVGKVGADDLRAITRLVLIGLVILPVLPDHTYGPYQVLNPFRIWLMVVLIVGISMGAYVAYKLLGERVGTLLAGILGGLISSTATTVSYSRHARQTPENTSLFAFVLISASTIVFGRVLFEITLIAPAILPTVAPPLLTMMGLMGLISAATFRIASRRAIRSPPQEPPSELRAAIVFGLLYALVILGVAAAKEHFGEGALYVVAALSGLTDMDAITLSTAQLVNSARLEAEIGWRLILIGAMANLVFKGAIVASLGHILLLRWVLVLFGLSLLAGSSLLVFWP